MTGTAIRVVIADDHPVVRDGLSALLASVPSLTVAGVAVTGREAMSDDDSVFAAMRGRWRIRT